MGAHALTLMIATPVLVLLATLERTALSILMTVLVILVKMEVIVRYVSSNHHGL